MKWTRNLIRFLLLLILGVCKIYMGTVQNIYIQDKVPIKGGDIQLLCEVSQFITGDILKVYKTDDIPRNLSTAPTIAFCTPSVCYGNIPRHRFSLNSSGITITVTNLSRSEDQKNWTCAILGQKKYKQLTVYTITPSLQYDNPPKWDQDLVQNSVTFECSTGCAYPSPNFKWYYNKTGGSRQEWSTTAAVTEKKDGCFDSEKIYTSTLALSRNTQFTDNTDTTVKFQCGAISKTGTKDQLFTQASVNVRFAVSVSTVTLKDGSSVPSNPLEVNSGEPYTLTCTSSVSRPTATIIWYFENQEKKSETTLISNFTFTPEYSDNGKQIYCKAFNIQSESKVSSKTVSLYVKVKVANVTLKDGNTIPSATLEVTNGVSKTLTCTASESRPTATIIWYIGDDEKKRENVTLSTLTFTPVISDHSKQVYCKASQSGNPDVFSNRITLYVKVLATTPTITDLTTDKFEGDQIRYQCSSSQTRPAAIVTWKLDNLTLTDVQNKIQSHGNDLKSVTSIVTFTANRTDNNKTIHCETAIPGQNAVRAQENMIVYWPPSQPRIRTDSIPFLEGQTGKSIYCSSSDYGNPSATAKWTKQYGTPERSDTRKLWLPKLTYQVDRSPVKCQLKNLFTQSKGLQIQSIQVLLQVEYSPRMQILVDGKQVNTTKKHEGQTLTATCNVTGNPVPVVDWLGQQSRDHTLSFDDIDRTDHGKYICKAIATSTHHPSHNFLTEEQLDVIVNYAPDVIVNVSSRNPTENHTLTVKCEPEGRPADYHISSIVHKWGDVVISKVLNPTNSIIEVQNAQLQDSGTYICEANNGIRDRNQKLDQSGNNTVKVKVSPKLLLKIGDRIIAGAPESTVNITAPFYSDPPPQTVQFKFKNGTLIINSSKHTVSFFKGNVKDTFYGKEVELDGYFAQLQIKNEEESDFVNYTLVINNGIGSYKSWILEHVSQSKPSIPKYFNFTGLKDGIPTFLLVGDFNGGLLQTFVIETTEVGKDNWVERLKFNETDTAFLQAKKLTYTFNISGLQPNVYDARVRTGNSIGWINETDALIVQFIITEKEVKPNPPGTVAAIAGGVAAASCVIILAIILVFVWKKRSKSKDDRSDVLNKRHRADSDSSEGNVMTENLAYVSADEVGRDRHMGATPENLYAQPQKKSKSATGTGDIYSSVQKGKKEDSSNIYALPNKKDKKNQKKDVKKDKNDKGGKKGKDKKQDRKDDVYENASELAPIKTKTYAGEENVYENPEQSKSTPKVNRNKDGLIYADLAFNDQPKGQKKLVIHGLDDMTEYVQVDFTKKADPLPDSDEEESAPKK